MAEDRLLTPDELFLATIIKPDGSHRRAIIRQDTKTAPIVRRETAAEILEFVKDWSGIDLDEFEAKYGISVRDGNCRVFPLPYLIQRWIESKYLGEVK